jgi:hypothetical protein
MFAKKLKLAEKSLPLRDSLVPTSDGWWLELVQIVVL